MLKFYQLFSNKLLQDNDKKLNGLVCGTNAEHTPCPIDSWENELKFQKFFGEWCAFCDGTKFSVKARISNSVYRDRQKN
jgi:hypothetical protein